MGSTACLSRVEGHGVRRGKGLGWAQAVSIAMRVWWAFCPGLSQLPNMPWWSGSQCNASFLEAQFCRVGPDPRMGAVGRRLTALVLGFGRFATQTSHSLHGTMRPLQRHRAPSQSVCLLTCLWFLPT